MKRFMVIAAVAATLSVSACSEGSDSAGSHEQGVPFPKAAVLDGALIDAYDTASLGQFGKSSFVDRVVEGTVTAIDVKVFQPGSEVVTFVSISTESNSADGPPETIVTRELGGVVTVEQVREEFEGRIPDAEIDAHASDTIDYIYNEQPHSYVGERVVVFLSGDPQSPDGYFSAATLEKTAGGYAWPDEPLVDAWTPTISSKTVDAIEESKG